MAENIGKKMKLHLSSIVQRIVAVVVVVAFYVQHENAIVL